MRIIAGSLRGRHLPLASPTRVRPTTDRVREALFSHLGGLVAGARVLDLFAGTGALGLESYSRGAAGVRFVEQHRKTAAILKQNVKALGAMDGCQVCIGDACKLLEGAGEPYDIIFVDPPYHRELVAPCLYRISAGGWLSPDGRVVVETAVDEQWVVPQSLQVDHFRRYGGTRISVLTPVVKGRKE